MRTPQPKRQLWVIAALSFLLGVLLAYAELGRNPAVRLLAMLFYLLSHFWVYNWYCHDSDAIGYRRTRLANICMVALEFIAVPWYLARSRAKGFRLKALMRFLGFALLLLLTQMAGAVAAYLIA